LAVTAQLTGVPNTRYMLRLSHWAGSNNSNNNNAIKIIGDGSCE